jgi:hypothetical protein
MRDFLWGALAMGCAVVGLIFLSSWRQTRDRLFLFFAWGFWMLGANWAGLALLNVADESRHYLHLFRLLGFVLILVGVIDKNRPRAP